jgi:hypothetical protein
MQHQTYCATEKKRILQNASLDLPTCSLIAISGSGKVIMRSIVDDAN